MINVRTGKILVLTRTELIGILVPKADVRAFKSPFLWDFLHLNVAMMTSNNALVPDPDKHDDLASSFWQWPILHVGLRMCSWDDNVVKYFLLGNPMVYWGSTAALGIFVLVAFVYLVRWQRGYRDFTNGLFQLFYLLETFD